LRGGPLLYEPARWNWSGYLETDGTRPLGASAFAEGTQAAEDVSSSSACGGKVSVRPTDSLSLSLAAQATTYSDRQHFAASVPLPDGTTWLVSHLEGRSRSLALRAEWHLRPELSIQYHGNPFGGTVRYGEFRQVLAPEAAALAHRLGSTLYLAWSQQRYGGGSDPSESAWSSLASLRSQSSINQLLLKVSYWFSS